MRTIQAERQALNNCWLEVERAKPRFMGELLRILNRYGFDLSLDGHFIRQSGEPLPPEVTRGMVKRA